eukprot:tig00021462_g21568.t1
MPKDGALLSFFKSLGKDGKDKDRSESDVSMHGGKSSGSRDSSRHGSFGSYSRENSMHGAMSAGWGTGPGTPGGSQRGGKLFDSKGQWGSSTPTSKPSVIVADLNVDAKPKEERGFFSKIASMFGDDNKLESIIRSLPSVSVGTGALHPYGLQSFQGPRDSQEDRYAIGAFEACGKSGSFFGVFDGHAGDSTAQTCSEMLRRSIEKIAQTGADTKSAIRQGVAEVDRAILQRAKETNDVSGSTACFAVILDGVCTVGNVGDSRAVLCRGGKAVDMSCDHRPSARRDELERVQRNGAWIDDKGMILGYLSMSRAMGEICLKDFRAGCFPAEKLGPDVVTCEPEILEAKLTGEDEFLIVATDGIWNRLESKEAVSIARQALVRTGDPAAAGKAVCDKAYGRKSTDNCTILVVLFRDFRAGASGAGA